MKKLINYLILSLFPLLSYAWTSSNLGTKYSMDNLVELSGEISFNNSMNQYEINCHITILENDTLLLMPGNHLNFLGHWRIEIYGVLIANGEKGNRILLGDTIETHCWSGIQIIDINESKTSIFNYCCIVAPHINIKEIGIYLLNSSPIINHCIMLSNYGIEESYFGTSIWCEGESYPIISNCEFYDHVNSCAIGCGYAYCEQDTVNYPSPLIYNCNIGGAVTWNLCGFPEWATVVNGGFLDNCYLGNIEGYIDTTLGTPVDTLGDGVCNTISTALYQRYYMVDGVYNPQKEPVNIGIQYPELEILPTTTEYLTLEPNHPNPFRNTTTITYTTLKENMVVRLELYNCKGELVSSPIKNIKHQAGKHTYTWNGCDNNNSKLPPGVYFYKITADNTLKTKQAILIK